MNRAPIPLAMALTAWLLTHCGSSAPELTIRGSEVLLATGDLDVRFESGSSFGGTYMLFGGIHMDHPNAVAAITLAGLSLRDAKPIHERHPDFHRCASPGAALAKDKVIQLDVVPANGGTLDVLRSHLDEFEKSLRNGGDRVCVELSGSHLKLISAEVREAAASVTEMFPKRDYYLVNTARRVECERALRGA